MSISINKKKLRKEMLSKRAKIPAAQKKNYDEQLCQQLSKIISERKAKTIHCYLPMGSEIDIFPLIATLLKQGLTLVTPKTLPKRKLENLVLNSLDELETGVFGTSHPANSQEYTGSYDIIIVPGLAYSSNNFRLGYGGGYYDNFMKNETSAYKIGISYPFQVIKEVPIEPHDVQLNDVLVI